MTYLEPCFRYPFVAIADVTPHRSFEQDGRYFSVLADTPFYPEGGGQPCDSGTVGGARVVDVRETNGEIVIETDCPVVPGTHPATIDIERRSDHAEQHTGQHLLSSVILRLFGGATESFHMGEEYSTIDVALPAMGEADIDDAENECFRIIRDDYPVTIHRCSRDEALKLPLRKAPVEGDLIRVVEIDGIDFSPCCGTHLPSTGKILALKILGTEKYKGKTRVSFAAGKRALLDHQKKAGIVERARNALSCSESELAERVASVAAELGAARKALKVFSEERAAAEAGGAVKESGGKPVVRLFQERSADEAFAFVKSCASLGSASVAASMPELKIGASFVSEESYAAFKSACLASGGKGGGSRAFFQAKFPDARSLSEFWDTLAR